MSIITDFRDRMLGSTAVTAVTSTVTKAFDIGMRGRRLAAIPSVSVAINTLISQYGRTAVARSRYLCLNNAYALSAKETFVSALVGYGIKPSTLGETPEVKTQVHEDWADWCAVADADGLTDFYGLEALAATELFEAGEVFVQLLRQPAGPDVVPLQLRIIPAEQLPYEYNYTAKIGPGNRMQMGIELDGNGKRVAYHFLSQNPGDATVYNPYWQTQRILAEDVIHLFKPIRAGQMRGVPHTLSGLISLAMLDLYDDAELERKRVAALFAAFVTKPSADDEGPLGGSSASTADPTTQSFTLRPGIVVDLLPGEDVTFSTPADVGANYETFQYRNLLRIAAGFGVPYAQMTGDLKAANYGSIRAGLVAFRRRIETMQWSMFIHQLGRPVWTTWNDIYTATGLAPWKAADYVKNRRQHLRVKWLTPRWDWVDPLKDLQAEKLAVDNGFKSRWDTIEEEGNDPSETDDRILEAQESEDDNELRINRFNSGSAAALEVGANPADATDPATSPGDGPPAKPAGTSPAKKKAAPKPKQGAA